MTDAAPEDTAATPEDIDAINEVLGKSIEDLDLKTARARHCLHNFGIYEGITTIGQLIQKAHYELIREPNLGKVTLNDIEQALAKMGLHLAGRNVAASDGPALNIPLIKQKIGGFRTLDREELDFVFACLDRGMP